MNNSEDHICGYLENILFAHPTAQFFVVTIRTLRDNQRIRVIGSLEATLPLGILLHCKGHWQTHAKHGKQFSITSFTIESPTHVEAIEKFLGSGAFSGIGPSYAKKIVEHFNIHTINILNEDPTRLLEVSGISEKRMQKLIKAWQQQKHIHELLLFLAKNNMPISLVHKLHKKYGSSAIEEIEKNPYTLTQIPGIGFKRADSLAQRSGVDPQAPSRIQASILYCCKELITGNGHTCISFASLKEEVFQLLGPLEEKVFLSVLDNLVNEKHIKMFDHYFFDPKLFFAEKQIALLLHKLEQTPSPLRAVDSNKAITWAAKQLKIHFAEEQKVALLQALSKKLLIVTGGPGTGKSTITKALLLIFSYLTKSIILCAPTGRAAQRLKEITSHYAHTIHALLERDVETNKFKRNQSNPLKCNLIIIDESSMIDTMLMFHLLQAIPPNAHCILIGDADQLPSIGPGKVLQDIINAEVFPTVKLQKVFRQKNFSTIPQNAQLINQGHFPILSPEENSHFQFIEEEDPPSIQQIICSLLHDPPKKWHPLHDIQVLTPMRKGSLGSLRLNEILQENMHKHSPPFFLRKRKWHLGDKIIQLKNNYNKKIYNGDIGFVTDHDEEEGHLVVTFPGKLPIALQGSEIDQIGLAYAVSIHKYQGSEVPCIILVIHTQHFPLLQKNLLYTGITRARKKVFIIGTKKAIAIAVNTAHAQQRTTQLIARCQAQYHPPSSLQNLSFAN